MTPIRLPLTRLALALLPLLHAGQAQTATVSWVGPSGGNWLDAANWSTGLLPVAGDDVQLGVFDTVITTPTAGARSVTGTGKLRLFSFGGNTLDLSGDSASRFDLLTVSSAAQLAGTLAVNLLAGAHFNVGDSRFASQDLSHAPGYTFATDYGANGLTLRVTTAAPVPEPGSWALMADGRRPGRPAPVDAPPPGRPRPRLTSATTAPGEPPCPKPSTTC